MGVEAHDAHKRVHFRLKKEEKEDKNFVQRGAPQSFYALGNANVAYAMSRPCYVVMKIFICTHY